MGTDNWLLSTTKKSKKSFLTLDQIEQAEKKIKIKLKDDVVIDFNLDNEEDGNQIFNNQDVFIIDKALNQPIQH